MAATARYSRDDTLLDLCSAVSENEAGSPAASGCLVSESAGRKRAAEDYILMGSAQSVGCGDAGMAGEQTLEVSFTP